MLTKSTRWTKLRNRLALSAVLAGAAALPAAAQTVYGIAVIGSPTTLNLVTFEANAPGTFTATIPLTGLAADQSLVGLDVRPNTGELFALGYNTLNNAAQLYTLNRTSGVLTTVGSAVTLNLGNAPVRIGFDFNPTADRIRVTAGNGANFRLNPNNGAIAATDGMLTYAATDATAGQSPIVGASAYTNSYIGSTATTLYDIEGSSRLVSQIPPNDGTLNTIGPLGVNVAGNQVFDLDIYFNPTTRTNEAYMSLVTTVGSSSTSSFYKVNLTTGAATLVGALGGPLTGVGDIAFAISRPATLPAVTGQLAYALAGTNLLTFDTALPGTIRTSVGITGVSAAQTLVGLDVRSLTNTLYALGHNTIPDNSLVPNSQLYTINQRPKPDR